MSKYENKSFITFYFLNFDGAKPYYNILGFFVTDTQREKAP